MLHKIESLVKRAIEESMESGELPIQSAPDPSVERPRDKEHGDWASSVAMKLAKEAHMNPRDIANIIASHIQIGDVVDAVEVAGPGFINLAPFTTCCEKPGSKAPTSANATSRKAAAFR